MKDFFDKIADVEVVIKNQRPSHSSIYTGYRPAFKIKDNYLTTGIIELIGTNELEYMNECEAKVCFITPELYTKCISIGQIIPFQEGKIIHGYVMIKKINNKLLEKE